MTDIRPSYFTPEGIPVSLFCFDDDGYPLEQCNECGALVPLGNELCGPCGHEEEVRIRLESLSDPNEGCWSYSW